LLEDCDDEIDTPPNGGEGEFQMARPAPQAGILNRPPDHALFVAINLTTAEPASTSSAMERLRELVHKELRSQLDVTTPDSPKAQPSAETGELGFDSGFDRYNLSITVGFASGAYAKLGVANPPVDLRPIDWTKLDDAPVNAVQSDLMLQICTNSIYIAEHVVRRVEEELHDVMSVAWVLPGSQRHTSRRGPVSRGDGRALIGFLDGTSNLDPRKDEDDRRLVFVDPDDMADYPPVHPDIPPGEPSPYGGSATQLPIFPPDLHDPPTPGSEPPWTREGTYMVVRASVIAMATWDAISIDGQEQSIGRRKVTGNPLATNPDQAAVPIPEPDFASDPEGAVTHLNAHIRKANPRGPGDEVRRIFRRGYPLILPTTEGLQLGLAFVCFARTITTQFEFITRAWTTNPDFPRAGAGKDAFRQFETVLGGGYYFVPALRKASQPWSWIVPPAA
jgi:deferrochelatase/peroxidase EfeB